MIIAVCYKSQTSKISTVVWETEHGPNKIRQSPWPRSSLNEFNIGQTVDISSCGHPRGVMFPRRRIPAHFRRAWSKWDEVADHVVAGEPGGLAAFRGLDYGALDCGVEFGRLDHAIVVAIRLRV